MLTVKLSQMSVALSVSSLKAMGPVLMRHDSGPGLVWYAWCSHDNLAKYCGWELRDGSTSDVLLVSTLSFLGLL